MSLPPGVAAWPSAWLADTRLYQLQAHGTDAPALPGELLVEHFVFDDALSTPFSLHLSALSLDAHQPLKAWCGRALTLGITLADGSRAHRSGYVTDAHALGTDGGWARYGLVLRPWIALLGHSLHSRVWQDKTVIEIIDDLFGTHAEIAAWRWDADVAEHVAQGLFGARQGVRPYCVQYRETDLDFAQRLLAEEGIGWRIEQDAEAPGGHTVVLFARSAAQPEDVTSASPWGGAGIRFHRDSSQEQQDSVQALACRRTLGPTGTTGQGWDALAHTALTAEVPTHHSWGGEEAATLQSWLTDYDPCGLDLYGDSTHARFTATRLQEALEARYKTWLGQASLRTLRPGTWVQLTDTIHDDPEDSGRTELVITAVRAAGINNLPAPLQAAIAEHLGPSDWAVQAQPACAELLERARQSGYACTFDALRRDVPWRPVLLDGTGSRPRPRPTALGPQTAIVVGPDGNDTPQGTHVLHTDVHGRVRVRFHWQDAGGEATQATARDSCWVRVMQRLAGPGMGHQFIPRIGQEVLIGFVHQDIDHPVVLASLYNGQGEGGIPPTPGGGAAEANRSAFADSTDHRPAAQLNTIAAGPGGHAPAWHGGAPTSVAPEQPAQGNAAALSGIKSQEMGGAGYNQLVFDDTPQQGRAWLHTTQAQTWLQMGHLLHQADNHRGSFRGLGFELRTDAWGGLRAARGLLLSTYGLQPGVGQTAEPAGDNAAGVALARQLQQLASSFQQAARTHQTVGVAATTGDAPATTTLVRSLGATAEPSQLPHTEQPDIAIVGKAGIGLTAGQDAHFSSGQHTVLASGQDTHVAVGGQARVHTRQAIGVLAGAIQPGQEAAGKGLTMIAAQGPIDLQAQAGPVQLAAKQTLELKSASGAINIAAAKKVVLAVSGGASITIEGGQFTAQCPGKLTVQAAKKSMVGGDRQSVSFPQMPKSICVECLKRSLAAAPAFTMVG